MFKTYSSSSSLVITSRWFATSRLRAPVSVRLVYSIWWTTCNILAPELTHLPLHKMATISQNIFRCIFVNEKLCAFWLKFHWSLFLWIQLTINSISLDNGLGMNRRQAIIWTKADSIHWCIYAAQGGDELTMMQGELMSQFTNTKLLWSQPDFTDWKTINSIWF